jgi:hypothetical protein
MTIGGGGVIGSSGMKPGFWRLNAGADHSRLEIGTRTLYSLSFVREMYKTAAPSTGISRF